MGNKEPKPQLKVSAKIIKSRLIDKTWLTPNIIRLRIADHYLANSTHPGQFVNIKISNNYIPLLRRPFSIHRINQENGWIEILFKIIGMGTELLARYEIGDEFDLLGPLGNSFHIPGDYDHAILIAGGLGIAPLLFLTEKLVQQKVPVTLLYGNKSDDAFCCLRDFEDLGVPYLLATEDGSTGFAGKVTELFLVEKEIYNKPEFCMHTENTYKKVHAKYRDYPA
jgi:dihydroorotate dehydrogenase electron transfer subunit